jgi:hypothetical protein
MSSFVLFVYKLVESGIHLCIDVFLMCVCVCVCVCVCMYVCLEVKLKVCLPENK